MSEAIPDDVMNLAFEAHGNLTMIFGDEDTETIARAILAGRAGREAEIEEKDERIAELEREADVVSAEFEGDCWRIVRRKDCFYPLELPRNDDLAAHATANPGTLEILDAETGETLWSLQ